MREPPYTSIDEYFPPWACQAAAAANIPIVLHLAFPLQECWREVIDFAQKYPDLRIVLAHMGRVGTGVGIAMIEAFRRVAEVDTVALDTSMAGVAGVHPMAIKALGPHRVLFGSDEPFNLLRHKMVDDPHSGQVAVPSRPYHWASPELYERHREADIDLVHFQVLTAVIEVIDQLYGAESDTVLAQVFSDNAREWFMVDDRK